MKRLYLLRHAKSSWDDPALADRDRPLALRGQRAAARMAEYLLAEGIRPDLVLCSDARRALETLDAIRPTLGGATIETDERLYAADADGLLARLHEVGDDAGSVMLIAHNPGMQDLGLELAGDGEPLPRLREKFPTGALATLSFECAWRDLGAATGTLRAFVVPRELT